MKITKTHLIGCFVIEPEIYFDKRGYFLESFNQKEFNRNLGLDINFIQDNESLSSRGVLRGLHYQAGDFAQAKLIRVTKGAVLDVVVDIRKESKTFGQHFSIHLSEDNKKQVFIPRGFAHGFLTYENDTIFSYKCDNYYDKASEKGIIYNDPTLAIDWHFKAHELILSVKDTELDTFEDYSR